MHEEFSEQSGQNLNYVINEQLMEKEKVNAAWEATRQQHEQLVSEGAQNFFSAIPGIEKAFEPAPGEVAAMCIDEGCCGSGVHTAGSGCLRKDHGTLIAELKAAGVTEFTTHGGCGAWALAHPEIADAIDRDGAVKAWGEEIAKELGVPHRFIPSHELDRAEFHDAVCAIYDGTGSFNRKGAAGLPHAFVASPSKFSSAKDDTELAARIALGEHGFGERFSAERPFLLIAAVDKSVPGQKEKLLTDLGEVVRTLPDGVVKIDTFET